jgi:hypothetical protein
METLEALGFSHAVDGDALAQAEQIAQGMVG